MAANAKKRDDPMARLTKVEKKHPGRQGDVIILRGDGARDDGKPSKPIAREGGRIILAYGTLTGHAHAIRNKNADLQEIEGTTDRLLRCLAPVALQHEEHGTIKLPAGNYRIRIQKEYSPEAIRNVQD